MYVSMYIHMYVYSWSVDSREIVFTDKQELPNSVFITVYRDFAKFFYILLFYLLTLFTISNRYLSFNFAIMFFHVLYKTRITNEEQKHFLIVFPHDFHIIYIYIYLISIYIYDLDITILRYCDIIYTFSYERLTIYVYICLVLEYFAINRSYINKFFFVLEEASCRETANTTGESMSAVQARQEEARRKRRKKKRSGSSLMSACFQGKI